MHSKYRKLLDPLFAPKRMDEQEADITRRVNGFIDAFADRGECNFTEELAELYPSSVFLGLMGLPEDELRMFLDLRDGILHPEKIDPNAMFDVEVRRRISKETGEQIYEYFGNLVDERTARPADDIITGFVQVGDRRRPAHARRHPRHLLPVPHRRPRHRERHAHVLVRVPRHAPGAPADDRATTRRSSRPRSRSCCGGSRR